MAWEIRNIVVVSYKEVTEALVKISNNGALPEFKKGLPAKRFHKDVENFISINLL